jgi:hypothetical protein
VEELLEAENEDRMILHDEDAGGSTASGHKISPIAITEGGSFREPLLMLVVQTLI